jgi:hypothetical protein
VNETMEIKTYEELEKYLDNAYKNSNFHDSYHEIKHLKKYLKNEDIIKLLKKQINKAKELDTIKNKEIATIEKKYKSKNIGIYEEALNYVTHNFQKGDTIVYYSTCDNCYRISKVDKLTKKGYQVFNGVKIGINEEVSFTNAICHANKINNYFDMKLKEEKQ